MCGLCPFCFPSPLTRRTLDVEINCSGVDFHNIVYDEVRNSLAVRMTVYIRPWLLLWRTINLELFALLELEDVIVVRS